MRALQGLQTAEDRAQPGAEIEGVDFDLRYLIGASGINGNGDGHNDDRSEYAGMYS